MCVNRLGISAAIVGLTLISVTAMPMPEQIKIQAIQPILRPSILGPVTSLQPLVAVFLPLPPDQGVPSSRPRGGASRLHAVKLTLRA